MGLPLFEHVLQKLADAVEPGVAAGVWRCGALEAVGAQGEGMQFALYAHAAHLLPRLHGAHGSIAVGVAMDEEHGGGLQVEAELWHEHVSTTKVRCSVHGWTSPSSRTMTSSSASVSSYTRMKRIPN